MEEFPHERFRKLCRNLRLNNAQSGLIRTDALRNTKLDRLYPGGDVVLMAELALLGRFLLLPDILLFRRIGNATLSSHLSPTDLRVFFDPYLTRHNDLRRFSLHLDFLRTVLRAPISISEKLQTLMQIFRHAIWDREQLWNELRNAL